MKKYILTLILSASILGTYACPACRKLQPKALHGITHGAGPGSNWDYLIVCIMVILTVYILVATIKCIIKPAEHTENHIKRIVLNN
nr:hypothetical protein [Mucilaginibacter sp. L294]